ncbi:hypothetical protein ATG98_0940 [Marinobacter sp. LV10R520-4]|uniref:hypothetical protein n=1 Tax=Marinobacter sp. LV10R520-4 TaxID=1761796 RepID=UPI000BFA8524|nr:hypothetical protein [Marinobacter sp. LV10R520-4]PFG51960.1 hypothetical protein ATG98_0940 [Marinobacter sp. LV10R520-4]
MEINLFYYPDLKLSPEARWLLLQWSNISGLDQTITSSLKELHRQLGMSPQHARLALDFLKANNQVIYETVRHGRGRPVSSHHVSPKFRQQLEKLDAPVTVHRLEIESLCHQAITDRESQRQKSQNRMSGEQRAKMFVPATYWLLAVLLAHAETPGIVRGLSYGQLRAVTGMTTKRLKSQLSKLKKFGVIARHEAGLPRIKEGLRMCSVYMLDLAHPLLLGETSIGLKVIFKSVGKHENLNFLSGFYEAAIVASELGRNPEKIRDRVAENLASDATEKDLDVLRRHQLLRERCYSAYDNLLLDAWSLLPPWKLLKPVADDLLRMHRLGMGAIFKAHIHSYAMMLLSNHWSVFEREWGETHDPVNAVMAAIQRDCNFLAKVDSEECEPCSNGPLFTFIYALSHHVAVQLWRYLKNIDQHSECDFSTAAFIIEPLCSEGAKSWKLEAYFRLSDGVTYLSDRLRVVTSVSLSLPKELDILAGEKHE